MEFAHLKSLLFKTFSNENQVCDLGDASILLVSHLWVCWPHFPALTYTRAVKPTTER